MNDNSLEYLYEQIEKRDLIKSSEKIEIYNALDKETQTMRILKICKGRDLSSVYEALQKEDKVPNVAVVYDCAYHNGDTHIIEEKLQGETLYEKLEADGVLSPEETVRIITKVCEGLSVLHNMEPPVIHKDIKPSNIFICDDNNVKVFDFDISRIHKENSESDTQSYVTDAYASPEHFGFRQTDQRSDVYSLGVTMHKMLSGKVLDMNREPTYTGKLSEIINKCVQWVPENRFQSAEELRIALLEQISPETTKILQTQPSNANSKPKKHGKGKILVALLILLFLGGLVLSGLVVGFVFGNRDKDAIVPDSETQYYTEEASSSVNTQVTGTESRYTTADAEEVYLDLVEKHNGLGFYYITSTNEANIKDMRLDLMGIECVSAYVGDGYDYSNIIIDGVAVFDTLSPEEMRLLLFNGANSGYHYFVFDVDDVNAFLDSIWEPGRFTAENFLGNTDIQTYISESGYLFYGVSAQGFGNDNYKTKIISSQAVDGGFELKVKIIDVYVDVGEANAYIYDCYGTNHIAMCSFGNVDISSLSFDRVLSGAKLTENDISTITVKIVETDSGLRLESIR